MSVRIRFRGGPLAGRVFSFLDEKERIVIGRDPEHVDVLLPADMTEVGREHLALKRVLGRYRLVLSPTHVVLLDGEPALDDMELPDVATLQLGRDGPVMVVQTLGTEVVPATIQPDTVMPDVPEMVRQTARRAQHNFRLGLLLTAVVAASAVGIVLAFLKTGERVKRVTEEQATVRAMLEQETATREKVDLERSEATRAIERRLEEVGTSIETIQPDLSGLRESVAGLGPRMQGLESRLKTLGPTIREALRRAKPSVYLVLIRRRDGIDDAAGTAWVAGKGVLVTNAHVATLFETIASTPKLKGAKIVVRSPGTGARDHFVEKVDIHPGWKVFGELWSEYRPTDVDLTGHLNPLNTAGACDVALLHVSDGDQLGPPLEIAKEPVLEALGVGDVVGFVGYPSENMASGGVNTARPSPTSQVAHITAMTNYFLAPDAPIDSLLVQHSLPATGGASGSPILDPDGHVVAVLNAGNVAVGGLGQRIPSAVLVNFAQRADLVQELLTGTADAKQKKRTERWREGIKTFTSLQTAVEKDALDYLRSYLEEVERVGGGKPEPLLDQQGIIGSKQKSPPPMTADEYPVHLPGPGVYVFFVHSALGQSIGLQVLEKEPPHKRIDRDRADHWYAVLQLQADKESDLLLKVAGYADTKYRVQIFRAVPAP